MWERVGREKLLLRCRLFGHARCFGAHGGGGGEGPGHIMAAARLQLVVTVTVGWRKHETPRFLSGVKLYSTTLGMFYTTSV